MINRRSLSAFITTAIIAVTAISATGTTTPRFAFLDQVSEFFGVESPATQTTVGISSVTSEPINSVFLAGPTAVSFTAMTTINCPAEPIATISPSVSGLTFSQISRGSGVTCATAGGSISGTGFNGNLATNIAGSKWYVFSITSDASTTFTVSSVSVVSRVSNAGGSPNDSVQYSIGSSSPTTVIGSFTPTLSSATYTVTPASPITVGAN